MRFLKAGTLALLIVVSTPAKCFLPFSTGLGHGAITRDGLLPIIEQVQMEDRRFTEAAIAEVVKANVEEDKIQSPERHFDAEAFEASSSRLVLAKTLIVRSLSRRDGAGARQLLGQVLHALQDYYSHTSHIDAGGPFSNTFNPSLGVETIKSVPSARCTNGFLFGGPSTNALTSGYYSLDGILLPGQTYEACEAPNNKCSHGNSFFGGFPNCGLNKDSEARPNHVTALQLATESTKAYTRLVLTQIRFELSGAEADIAICRLMGIAFPEVTCAPPIPCDTDAQCGEGICSAGLCIVPRPFSTCSIDGIEVSGCLAGEYCNHESGKCMVPRPDQRIEGLVCPPVGISGFPDCPSAQHPFILVVMPIEDCTNATQEARLTEYCFEFWQCNHVIAPASCESYQLSNGQGGPSPSYTIRGR